jgi:type I restriction enzyme M protein
LQRWNNLDKENKRTKTDKSFLATLKEIEANGFDLSINRYKEVVHEEKAFEKPGDIIVAIKELDKERTAALKTLEGLLK